MSERPPARTVDMSMINLIDTSTVYLAPMPAEVSTLIAKAAGYDGTQFVSTRITDLQIKRGISNYALQAIHSAAQGYRSEHTWQEASSHDSPAEAKGAFIVFPHMDATLDTLRAIQRKYGKDIPVTLQGVDEIQKAEGLQHTNLIVTPEIYSESGAQSIDEFLEFVKRKGFKSVCVDPYQLRRTAIDGSASPFGEINEALEELLPHAGVVNLSFGRRDLGTGVFDPISELRDVIHGTNGTGIFDMLQLIKKHYAGPIAVQIPPRAIKEALNISKPLITPRQFVKTHKAVAQNLKTVFTQ